MAHPTLLALVPLAFGALFGATNPLPELPLRPGDTAVAQSDTIEVGVKISGDVVKLTGELADGVVEVGPGETITIELQDTADHYVYAVILAGGATPEPWLRAAGGNSSYYGFSDVAYDIVSVVVVEEKNAAKIKYGPVITVKPKG